MNMIEALKLVCELAESAQLDGRDAKSEGLEDEAARQGEAIEQVLAFTKAIERFVL